MSTGQEPSSGDSIPLSSSAIAISEYYKLEDFLEGAKLGPLSSSAFAIAKYYKIADFSEGAKLGFQQILQVYQRIEQQTRGLMDGELYDVLVILLYSTYWLAKRYKSVADMLDNLISVEYFGRGLRSLNLSGGTILDEHLSTPNIFFHSQRRRYLKDAGEMPALPRQIQELMVGPLLEELNVGICLLTILDEKLGQSGHQVKPEENSRKSLHRHVLPLTKFARERYKDAESLLLHRGIRADDFSSSERRTDTVRTTREAAISEIVECMGMQTWNVFQSMFLLTQS